MKETISLQRLKQQLKTVDFSAYELLLKGVTLCADVKEYIRNNPSIGLIKLGSYWNEKKQQSMPHYSKFIRVNLCR